MVIVSVRGMQTFTFCVRPLMKLRIHAQRLIAMGQDVDVYCNMASELKKINFFSSMRSRTIVKFTQSSADVVPGMNSTS